LRIKQWSSFAGFFVVIDYNGIAVFFFRFECVCFGFLFLLRVVLHPDWASE